MNAECKGQDEKGSALENGFCVLDIIKHALKTVVMTMRPHDRLAVVVFDDNSEVLFNLSTMNKRG